MSNCIFCQIVNKEIESEILYEDDRVLAFKDVNAQAPVHNLIIPKKHIETILDLEEEEQELIGHIHQVANQLAIEEGIAADGFRIVNNCREDGGQTVFHLHFHLLGGRSLEWPPG